MAAPQIGDVIKFAEIAWTLLNYGWSDDLNATRQFREFGRDLSHLAESLQRLEDVINNARSSFQYYGQTAPHDLGWDEDSLIDIIGDYYATLNECLLLVKANKTYMGTITGPLANIHWNIFVQPQVEKLRRRILLHNTKVQHVLQPFEIDLRMRIHRDLVQRITHVHRGVEAVHHDVRRMHRQLQALMRAFDPSLIQGVDQFEESEICEIDIPDEIRRQLQAIFENHPGHEVDEFDFPPLRDIADAFVTSFDKSTRLLQSNDSSGGITEPQEEQYLALLTSQFLMSKALESPEYRDATPVSHWPSYVRSLQRQLSDECRRFAREMQVPAWLSDGSARQVPTFWPEEEPPEYIDSVELPTPMELLLELSLATETTRRWRKLKLFRFCDGTDKCFRLVITAGDRGEPARQTLPIDFDITKATLIPQYASPDGREPLELLLKDGRDMHRLVFCSRSDLYTFQQALTAYEVVDQYMAYRVQVVFVLGSGQKVMEEASLQLWQPSRLAGERVVSGSDSPDSGSTRRMSTASSGSTIRRVASSSSTPASNARLPARIQINNSQGLETPPSSSPTSSAASPTRSSGNLFGNFTFNQPPASPPARRTSTFQDLLRSPRATPTPPRHAPGPVPMPSPTQPTPRTWSLPFSSPRPQQPRRQTTTTTTTTSIPTAGPLPTPRPRPMSIASTASTATTARPIPITSTAATVADTGTLHTMPTEPLLVLFTRHPDPRHHSPPTIVALSIDPKTTANYRACRCTSLPDCRITALERGASGGRAMKVLRLGGGGGGGGGGGAWDVLPLAEALRSQRGGLHVASARGGGGMWRRGVIRVSVCFERVEARIEFAGLPCGCVGRTEGQLMECLRLGHWGRLGLVKEMYRRGMVGWNRMRFEELVDVVGAAERS